MSDMLLIKKLNQEQFNNNDVIPVTFTTNTSDRSLLVEFFSYLKKKNLVETNRLVIKNTSITIDLISFNITQVIKELINRNFMLYGVYILYDDYLGGEHNE